LERPQTRDEKPQGEGKAKEGQKLSAARVSGWALHDRSHYMPPAAIRGTEVPIAGISGIHR